MKRKIAGLVLFCLILFAAILAGYWDMLSAEKLKIVRDKASNAVGEIADIVRDDPAPAPAETAAAPAADAARPQSSAPADGESVADKGAEPASATPAPPPSAARSSETGAAPPAAAETAVAPPSASPDAAKPASDAPAPPTFDILRVEPDGSTVLAGRAPAGASVSLLDGMTKIGSETANTTGEFVVVLDERLSVGDHQIKIEATLPDGRSVASAETAIVSIPETGREADLLAMVEAPDQASRLISVPAAKAGDTTTGAESEAAGAGEDIAALQKSEPPAGDPLLPGAPRPGSGVVESPGSAAPPPAVTSPAVTSPGASATAAFSSPPAAGAKASATLLVEAVEIENDTVYVAGRSTGGASVRVYVDNAFLAEDRRPAAGRFLVSAKAPVATGDHTVRADSLDASGAVLARVEVPFFKPEGEAMAAVSPDEAAPDTAAAGSPPSDAGAADAAALPSAPEASATDRATVAAPPAEMPAPAADPAETAGATPPSAGPDTPSLQAGSAIAEAPVEDTPPPPESPADALADRMAAADPATTPPVSDPVTTAPTLSAAPTPNASPASAEPAAPSDPTSAESGGDIAVTRQPALQGAPSRVIIRRGDTLWRISRETYGLGRRYTVIYLANGDQIRNPDRIYPGQVFRVPKDDAADASRVQ